MLRMSDMFKLGTCENNVHVKNWLHVENKLHVGN